MPCVESSLVWLEDSVSLTSYSLGKTLIAFALLHSVLQDQICLLTPGISWLPTFVFQSPIMKRIFWGVLVLEGLVGVHRTIKLQLLQHYWLGHRLMVENLPCDLGGHGFDPFSGKIPHASGQLGSWATTTEAGSCKKRSHCNEKPLLSTTRGKPLSSKEDP